MPASPNAPSAASPGPAANGGWSDVADHLHRFILQRLHDREHRLRIVGLCGAQGSGKSTASAAVAHQLSDAGCKVLLLSLDDLYLPLHARQALARGIHPLLRVRGVPGTHDLPLGEAVFAAAAKPGAIHVPRFDKASDDRAPQAQWPVVQGPVDLVLLEGWCVGAAPQAPQALAAPINALERDEDADGRWRRHVNAQLAGPYQRFFASLDDLILLAAPEFDIVAGWRRQQEAQLRQHLLETGADPGRAMSDAQIDRFVLHYERLTRHILNEMPQRADLVLRLDGERRLIGTATARE